MPRLATPLTDTQIRQAKPKDKPYKLYDAGGLFLLINPTGGKWWRLKYRLGGKEAGLSLGIYPAVTLKAAREERDRIKRQIAEGLNPASERKQEKECAKRELEDRQNSFQKIALEWFYKQEAAWRPNHARTVISRIERFLLPAIGQRPIAELKTRDYADVIRAIDAGGHAETARRVAQICGQITRYACAAGLVEYDAAQGISRTIASVPTEHFAAITNPQEYGRLLLEISEYQGRPSTAYALRIMPYVFVRSSELRNAAWQEIDLENGLWTIPACRMKMKREHLVPLAPQVVKLFQELREFTGAGQLVFPGYASTGRAITDVCLLNALRRIGYDREQMTIHGFRSAASTMLNELGYQSDWIEAQLAHAAKDSVRAAYNRAQWLPERTGMMNEWADYLDGIRAGNQKAAA